MNVVRFPTERLYRELTSVEKTRVLLLIVTGLRTLGEPATTAELGDFVEQRLERLLAPRIHHDVGAILRAHTEPSAAHLFGETPFRRVVLGAAEAWAFTKPFRMLLTNSGLEVRLRPLRE